MESPTFSSSFTTTGSRSGVEENSVPSCSFFPSCFIATTEDLQPRTVWLRDSSPRLFDTTTGWPRTAEGVTC